MITPQEGPQSDFLTTTADIAIYGGAAGGGKTYAILMEASRNIHVSGYSAVIFRRTYPQIMNPGGMWDQSIDLYQTIDGARQVRGEWSFPSGAKIVFKHMQYDKDKYDYQGSQIPFIGFDELTHFSEDQFFYMLSRNRSMCGVIPYVRGTCNPDSDSWVAKFIEWWIAPDGYADMSRAGSVRWMVRVGGTIEWADSAEELKKSHPKLTPKSVTFIMSSVYDNKMLLERDPSYIANLMALPSLERMRLLGDPKRGGNWHIRAGGTKFKREWFLILDNMPDSFDERLRFWDLAATEPAPGRDADWTVGALVGLKAGRWYVLDVRRIQGTPMNVEALIRQTAIMDGRDVPVRIEEEGGASGRSLIDHYRRNVLVGFNFDGVRMGGSKEQRASPMSAAAEAGNVILKSAPWNSAFLDEFESFSPTCVHDDQVDATDGAFNCISETRLDPHIGSGMLPTVPAISRIDERVAELVRSMSPEERLKAEAMLNG